MTKVGLGELASLYEALADARGIGPREADELFIWEAAVLLGVGTKKRPETDKYAHLRARVNGEKFEWPDPSPEEQQQMMALMGALQ